MEIKRKPFQGVINIVRFNHHFYIIALLVLSAVVLFHHYLPLPFWLQSLAVIGALITLLMIAGSLAISYFIYDWSDLYHLNWLPDLNHKKVMSIHAGFDETSTIITQKFKTVNLTICDFYDPQQHTEISIRRARKIYPPHRETIAVVTDKLPFPTNHFDVVSVIFSAHEIRDVQERILFFKELRRIVKPFGMVYVTEHLRDRANFVAYSIGFFHFYSRKSWRNVFKHAALTLESELKSTPFISTFQLKKHGNTV